MGNSKRALDEIRTGYRKNQETDKSWFWLKLEKIKKFWYLWLKLKEIKKFWYQCLWCGKVAPESQNRPEKITRKVKVAPGQPEKITLADAFSDYEQMKESKNVWRCPW
jgi:hypothetical protein